MWHPRPRAEDVLCKKASCPRGSWPWLTAYAATGITAGENSWLAGRERIGQKNEKYQHVSFKVEAASRKKRKWYTIRCSRRKLRCVDRVASHISTRTWIAAQKPGSIVKISFPLLDISWSTFLPRSRSTTQLATHGAAPKSIGCEVE